MVEDYRSDTFRFFSELPCERRPLTFPPPAERDSGRSEHWKRSNPSLAQSAKAVPPSSFPASADWACFEKMESKIEVSLGFAGWS